MTQQSSSPTVIRNVAGMSYLSTVINVRRSDSRARLPAPAHEDDVGFDLYPLDDIVLSPGRTTVVPTGVYLAAPPGYLVEDGRLRATFFMKIEGRSGLAANGVFPVGGIIDPSYRGEIKAILFNSTDEQIVLSRTRAMAQLVIYHVETTALPYKIIRFLDVDEVTSSDRGTAGFGSTDQKASAL